MKKYSYRKDEYINKLVELFKVYGIYKKNGYLDNYLQEIYEKYDKEYIKCIGNMKELLSLDGIENYLRIYTVKYIIWRKEFCGNNYLPSVFETAVIFNIFCCLVDGILDGELINITKESALEKINWKSMERYFGEEIYTYNKDILDLLYNKISIGFKYIKLADKELYKIIKNKIYLSFQSEIYVSTTKFSVNNKEDMDLLINKSIQFVEVCFLIAAIGTKEIERLEVCTKCEAKIFWLIDELCDLYDDIETETKNSILCKYISNNNNINRIIDNIFLDLEEYVNEIKECMNILKNNVGREVYDFLLTHVIIWSKDLYK